MRARPGFLLLVALGLVLLPGCEVEIEVALDVDRDGAGEVVVSVALDDEAARQLGELEKELRTGDLRDAGWDVRVDDAPEGAAARIVARRPFGTPEQAEQVLRQVTGEDGALRAISIHEDRSFFRTTTRFEATADLRGGLEAFGDAELTERLGGMPLGVSIDEIEEQYGIDVDEAFSFTVRADLPGTASSNAPGEQRASWSPELGERIEIRATGRAWNTERIVWPAVAVVATLALVAYVAARLARRRLVSWS